ncbi:MAG: energy transducer TonB, partial [Bacteroidales bacterium]|nr:energy transducer TonB [Bacteroidales bacterium]
AVAENVKKEVEAEEVSEVVVAEAQHEELVAEEVIVEAVPMMQKAALRTDDAKKEKGAARPAAAGTQGVVVPDSEASPVGGMEEFREWVARNIRYPEGVDPVERQVIVVTFRVRTDSTIYDMKAERTSGDLFTREAYRLIREGPKWTPAIRNGKVVEEEARVSVVFK